jgi:hypothetical protein
VLNGVKRTPPLISGYNTGSWRATTIQDSEKVWALEQSIMGFLLLFLETKVRWYFLDGFGTALR